MELKERSFQEKYLIAVHALHNLGLALANIGMGYDRGLRDLQNAVIAHGAETLDDINDDRALADSIRKVAGS